MPALQGAWRALASSRHGANTALVTFGRRRGLCRPQHCSRAVHSASAGPPATATSDAAWGEQTFSALQKKATSRLHRFYVPQPLGPTPEPATLEALLGGAVPAVATASSSATAASVNGSNSSSSTNGSSAVVSSAPAADGGSGKRRKAGSSTAAAAAASAAADAAAAAWAGSVAAGVPATLVLEGEEARHAARALRLAAGDRVELCDGRGNVAEGVVTGTDKQRMWVSTEGAALHQRWAGPRWVLAVACTTLKGGRAEWLVEKATELGAFMLVPLVTERSQAGGKAKFRTSRGGGGGGGGGSDSDWGSEGGGDDYQPGRLERVAIAATKQSLRPHALALTPPTPLKDLLPLVRRAAAEPAAAAAIGPAAAVAASAGGAGGAAPGGGSGGSGDGGDGGVVGCGGQAGFSLVAVAGAPALMSVLQQLRGGRGAAGDPAGRLDQSLHTSETAATDATRPAAAQTSSPVRVLFVGPEGDFTPAELAALVEAGARPVGLGANRLRTETAAIGLLSACLFSD
ncbi:hypothetical protein HYH02_000256 [Chlamydomonas schloesseri]|uniref:16S rRNA (uracil(1498)-N(3))-methyltransferase n=1 Tax=Chlamydomonas schloesseri TaxID=2026947 RepID=A0A835WMV6_9CHLO|nr:hypothetical protein HYH02_000256 [Chlamydomonas schloesseri]|eukprot:KAG2450154.1 hypothetical protein HYH02_000256 [Chlamydomonas schloesseri]